tara:strand:- start:35 stop:691 length:657 start_codon:yes stop_codon:yes gene_type:complete
MQVFNTIGATDKARYTKERADAPAPLKSAASKDDASPSRGSSSGEPVSTEIVLPLARIKRLMRCDPEVGHVSKDATVLMTKATESFIESIVARSIKASASKKRKTVKYEDFAASVHRTEHLVFLTKDVPLQSDSGKRAKAAAKAAAARRAAVKKSSVVEGAGSIGTFFAQATKEVAPIAAEAAAEEEEEEEGEGGEAAAEEEGVEAAPAPAAPAPVEE